jgi:hypothetical protein
VNADCYELFQYRSGWIDYLKLFSIIARYFAASLVNIGRLEESINDLQKPTLNTTEARFRKNLDMVIEMVSDAEKEINKQLQNMTCLECERLGEAITCNYEGCFTASVVMAASAVEARLHELIKNKNRKIYNQYFRDKPLGTLINLFDKNSYKDKKFSSLKKIIPDIHKSLLDIVNDYRILSAHPIMTEVDHKVSESVINLTFLFLLDPKLKIKNKKLLLHN